MAAGSEFADGGDSQLNNYDLKVGLNQSMKVFGAANTNSSFEATMIMQQQSPGAVGTFFTQNELML